MACFKNGQPIAMHSSVISVNPIYRVDNHAADFGSISLTEISPRNLQLTVSLLSNGYLQKCKLKHTNLFAQSRLNAAEEPCGKGCSS